MARGTTARQRTTAGAGATIARENTVVIHFAAPPFARIRSRPSERVPI
jgi:hypothetical protein